MPSKRQFLKSMALSAMAPFALKDITVFDESIFPAGESNEDFWKQIRKDYLLKPNYINLENGYYCMASQPVLEGYIKEIRSKNLEASYYLRTEQFNDRDKVRKRLADLFGCKLEELIITRNTTESLDTIISGINWKTGDEALMAEQDYGSMLDMFKQQARRFGIVNKVVSIPNNPQSDEELVALYASAITPKTKLMMICHMINITGQILPVKKICEMAHSKGVEVLVDGAHAIAHLDFRIDELGCDYYGSSLHKWLGSPLGAGILYVNKNKIKSVWPLFGESNFADDDILKLNHTGTVPVATNMAIHHAIDYHEKIGIKRKNERLRYLQNYWVNKVKGIERIILNTPEDINRSCAIANVGIDGIPPSKLAKILLEKYKIWTVAIDYANVHGVRVTPHLFTTSEELDQLVAALIELSEA
jgi:selenocysteine lyase/cysteine desulfurase